MTGEEQKQTGEEETNMTNATSGERSTERKEKTV